MSKQPTTRDKAKREVSVSCFLQVNIYPDIPRPSFHSRSTTMTNGVVHNKTAHTHTVTHARRKRRRQTPKIKGSSGGQASTGCRDTAPSPELTEHGVEEGALWRTSGFPRNFPSCVLPLTGHSADAAPSRGVGETRSHAAKSRFALSRQPPTDTAGRSPCPLLQTRRTGLPTLPFSFDLSLSSLSPSS